MRWLIRISCWPLFIALGIPAAAAEPSATGVSSRVDALLEARAKQANVLPEPVCDDATFCRRAWLDLVGRVPTALAARQFLEDRDPAKRVKLIDALLAGDDFADHWGRAWTQLLTGQRAVMGEHHDGRRLHVYLRQSFAANKPYRDVVTELVTARGIGEDNGPVNFLLRYEAKPAELAGAVGRAFLGVTLQCAQCHDHPMAHWKKDDFWRTAALFGRLRLFTNGDDDPNLSAVLERSAGDLTLPDAQAKPDKDGKPPQKAVAPGFPGEKPGALPGNRRQALARWITSPSNPYSARNVANQVWAQLFGTPLLRALDKLDTDNPNQAILDLLAEDFNAHAQDLKRVARAIALSQAYQRGAGRGDVAEETRAQQLRHFARYPARPLSSDQLYQSIAQATGHRAPEDENKEDDELTEGDKAVEVLTDRPLSVQQALALMNGGHVHEAVKSGAKAALALHGGKPGAAHVEWLFLATLSRRPTAEESAAMLQVIRDGKKVRGLEDVLWVLLNSAEFTTNH
jgi:hypothetical protein